MPISGTIRKKLFISKDFSKLSAPTNLIQARIIYHSNVVERDIPALPRTARDRIRTAIETRLTSRPEAYGKPLRYSLHSLWSLRVGDYRVIYRIDGDDVVVLRIGHRRDVYR